MSFTITSERDYLEQKSWDDMIRKERAEDRKEELKKLKPILDDLKKRGKRREYFLLLRRIFQ